MTCLQQLCHSRVIFQGGNGNGPTHKGLWLCHHRALGYCCRVSQHVLIKKGQDSHWAWQLIREKAGLYVNKAIITFLSTSYRLWDLGASWSPISLGWSPISPFGRSLLDVCKSDTSNNRFLPCHRWDKFDSLSLISPTAWKSSWNGKIFTLSWWSESAMPDPLLGVNSQRNT